MSSQRITMEGIRSVDVSVAQYADGNGLIEKVTFIIRSSDSETELVLTGHPGDDIDVLFDAGETVPTQDAK